MQGVGGCGPNMAQAQNAQSVQGKQLENQIQMAKVLEKVGKGEISKEEGGKQIAGLMAEQVKLQQGLAPSAAGGATASSPTISGSSTGTGFSSRDTFESAPAGKPLMMLNPSSAPPATTADLDGKGGGSKPGVGGLT
jgi:hypothetical protein